MRHRFLSPAVLLLAAAATSVGCEEKPASNTAPVHRFEVRGQVTHLPHDGHNKIDIHHEAIPDFIGISGGVEPMAAMVMGMSLGQGVDLEGIAVGDKVKFTLAVQWGDTPSYWIENVEKLPADTHLHLTEGDHSGHDH